MILQSVFIHLDSPRFPHKYLPLSPPAQGWFHFKGMWETVYMHFRKLLYDVNNQIQNGDCMHLKQLELHLDIET